ncbi:probable receptor-like protein kinase At1g80640 isoform X2 [Andrographis paniculata]|uniref:probable receptor-like protein kinase At1g80640 isoform X2 n=1 Tax=Andrographis paniculata TaxID=175694 RepID=UPI0021E81EEC|nr:probable receptor-like protein kinase At1g80640 isoform X2 [Andrographis paniculata]
MELLLLLLLFLLVIWSFSIPSSCFPVDVRPDPPVADPVLPIQTDPFFKNSSDLTPHSSPGAAEVEVVQHKDLNKKILVALVVSSSLLGTILLALSCFSIYRLKKLKKNPNSKNDPANGISLGPILDKFSLLKIGAKKGPIAAFEYPSLVAATNNFDEGNVIGEGGNGRVYKACFDDRLRAAVKKIVAGDQEAEREFENEVELLSKIRHQNVVSLLGYCIRDDARFLVYEMMDNRSLDFHLHRSSYKSKLTWHMRMKIALDVARGLEYLHERCNPTVIHRDLKSSNILLDANFNAKLSDFGLAISGGNSNRANVKLSGTVGYVAPEYLLDGKLTDKSDVYAFGVVLLELLTGRRPVERVAEGQCQSIVTWAMPKLTDRSKLPSIVDAAIRNTMDLKHLYQVAAIGILCVQPEPSYRPLITDVLHSFIPLVPVDLGGSLRAIDSSSLA